MRLNLFKETPSWPPSSSRWATRARRRAQVSDLGGQYVQSKPGGSSVLPGCARTVLSTKFLDRGATVPSHWCLATDDLLQGVRQGVYAKLRIFRWQQIPRLLDQQHPWGNWHQSNKAGSSSMSTCKYGLKMKQPKPSQVNFKPNVFWLHARSGQLKTCWSRPWHQESSWACLVIWLPRSWITCPRISPGSMTCKFWTSWTIDARLPTSCQLLAIRRHGH